MPRPRPLPDSGRTRRAAPRVLPDEFALPGIPQEMREEAVCSMRRVRAWRIATVLRPCAAIVADNHTYLSLAP